MVTITCMIDIPMLREIKQTQAREAYYLYLKKNWPSSLMSAILKAFKEIRYNYCYIETGFYQTVKIAVTISELDGKLSISEPLLNKDRMISNIALSRLFKHSTPPYIIHLNDYDSIAIKISKVTVTTPEEDTLLLSRALLIKLSNQIKIESIIGYYVWREDE